jgi:CRP-like cAMP-binding protein
MRNSTLHVSGKNHLLELLPPKAHARVMRLMDEAYGADGDVLFPASAPINHVYFPTSGVISIGVDFKDGRTAEVGIVGNEGMAGLQLLHKTARNRVGAWFKVSGSGMRMTADAFTHELERREDFERVVSLYAEAFFGELAQSAACNLLHSIEQRLCRWILMAHDRIVPGDAMNLTQEQFAKMLCVRRATIAVAASGLQKAGLIAYTRGRVRVVRRAALEARSCECYKVVRAEFERLLC